MVMANHAIRVVQANIRTIRVPQDATIASLAPIRISRLLYRPTRVWIAQMTPPRQRVAQELRLAFVMPDIRIIPIYVLLACRANTSIRLGQMSASTAIRALTRPSGVPRRRKRVLCVLQSQRLVRIAKLACATLDILAGQGPIGARRALRANSSRMSGRRSVNHART